LKKEIAMFRKNAIAASLVVLCSLSPAPMLAQSYRILHSFNGSDGTGPSGIVVGGDGNLFGVAPQGGSFNMGLAFKMDPSSGKVTVLHSFNTPDGTYPSAPLVAGTNGSLYGTAMDGGSSGWGTVFKLTPAGNLTVLHSFAGPPTDGRNPQSSLLVNTAGALYGVTYLAEPTRCHPCGRDTGLSSSLTKPETRP
jgi:uncharacterized repeat protein (TIGR03803 family)